MKAKLTSIVIMACLFSACTPQQTDQPQSAVTSGTPDRTVLPIKEPTYPNDTTLDARNGKAPARFEVKAPEKAPNIVIVLIDDQGFGVSSAFGGPVQEPTLEKLAANGCPITDGIPIPNLNRFEFRDPFGNRVEFLERSDSSQRRGDAGELNK